MLKKGYLVLNMYRTKSILKHPEICECALYQFECLNFKCSSLTQIWLVSVLGLPVGSDTQAAQ